MYCCSQAEWYNVYLWLHRKQTTYFSLTFVFVVEDGSRWIWHKRKRDLKWALWESLHVGGGGLLACWVASAQFWMPLKVLWLALTSPWCNQELYLCSNHAHICALINQDSLSGECNLVDVSKIILIQSVVLYIDIREYKTINHPHPISGSILWYKII